MAPARKSSSRRTTVETVETTVVKAPSTPLSQRLQPADLPASPLGATPRGALPQVYTTPHKNYDLSEEDLSRIAEEAETTLRNRASLYTAERSTRQTWRLVTLVKPSTQGRARLLWAIAFVLLAVLVAVGVLYWRGVIFNTVAQENTVTQETKQ